MGRYVVLSLSRVRDFKRYPPMPRFWTVDRLPEPPSLEVLQETFVHSVLGHFYNGLAVAHMGEIAQGPFLPHWNVHLGSKPRDHDLSEGSAYLETWLGSAHTLVGNYLRTENPTLVEPVVYEQSVSARLAPGLAVRGIVGWIDEALNGVLHTVDYKTGEFPGPGFQDKALF